MKKTFKELAKLYAPQVAKKTKDDPYIKNIVKSLIEDIKKIIPDRRIILIRFDLSGADVSDINCSNSSKFTDDFAKKVADKNHFLLNINSQLIESSFLDLNSVTHDFYCELSTMSLLFVITIDGLDIYYMNQNVTIESVFYTYERLKSYKGLKTMSDFEDILKDYENGLATSPHTENLFYAEKVQNSLNIPYQKHLLKDKTEDRLRNNLYDYLRNNVQGTWTTEERLPDKSRTDIAVEYNNQKIIIETKWSGKSINQDNNGVSTTHYTSQDFKNGVIQTLQYIKLSIEQNLAAIRCGYIVVFNCTENELNDEYIINYPKYIDEEFGLSNYYVLLKTPKPVIFLNPSEKK